MLTKIMIGAGLATILATSASMPAMAQSYQPEVGSGNIAPNEYSNSLKPGQGENAFAFLPGGLYVQHNHSWDRHTHDLDRR